MKNRLLAFAFSLMCAIGAHGQHFTKINHDLKSYLQEVDSNQFVPLLIEGNSNQVETLVESFGGRVRLALPPYYSIDIPANQVESFSENQAIKHIEFSLSPGKALADTMLVNVRADQVHQITSPLREKYTGKGVLLGVIDSGIELAHDDFKDSSNQSRVLYIWDQSVPFDPNYPAANYNYGVEWDSSHINQGISTHDDQPSENGHGSNVTGAAASNGRASGNFVGVAPEVNIISVATDFSKPNWLQTVVEATDYIFRKADQLNMPVVINASVGTYVGSHDGRDIAARMIDILIKQKSSRAFVCAAGNAATVPFHLQHQPNNDTLFTWFTNQPQLFSGVGGVYFEMWSDSADFDSLHFAIGADRPINNSYEYRGRSTFKQGKNILNQIHNDSIVSLTGNTLARISYFTTYSQGRYKVEVAIPNPDSSGYFLSLETAGRGKLDIWSSFQLFRHSSIVGGNLPSASVYPRIQKYQKPDTLQTIVSSFTCLPSVITVGNYVNRSTYTDVSGTFRNVNQTPGQISINSSLGPNRDGYLKPDISSAGDYMFAAGRLATIQQAIQSNPAKVSQDSLHFRNGGTSMAAPTVAGMVALLFEKCRNLDYQAIKSKLIQSARTDAYTQNLPNPKWGHGKADAYTLLSNEVFPAILTLDTIEVCSEKSVPLTTTQSFQNYLWNTSDTSRVISIDTSGSFFATVYNSSLCREMTDTAISSLLNSPAKPSITQSQDSLFTTASGQLQWYRNQVALPGATQNFIKAFQTGFYYVEITAANGCTNTSDTLFVNTVGLNENKTNEYLLYPNPVNQLLTIDFIQAENIIGLKLIDLNGKELFNPTITEGKQRLEVDLSLINKGIYLLQIQTDRKLYQEKILIQ